MLAVATSLGVLAASVQLLGDDASDGAAMAGVAISAFAGDTVMGTRHSGTWLLSLLLFLPLMTLFLLLVGVPTVMGRGIDL